jgi:hypothetical protein
MLNEGNLVSMATDQRGCGIVCPLERRVSAFGGFVPTHLGLQSQMGHNRLEDRLWHQRRASVVEVQYTLAAGRLTTGAL